MANERVVDVTAAEMRVVRSGFDDELALVEGDNSDRERRMTSIDEDDISGGLVKFGEITLSDTVAEGHSSRVVDDAEGIQARD